MTAISCDDFSPNERLCFVINQGKANIETRKYSKIEKKKSGLHVELG